MDITNRGIIRTSLLFLSDSLFFSLSLSLSLSLSPQRGGGSVTKTMASHGAEVLRRLRGQREAGLFCDITLRTEGRAFSAHRAVLAAASEFFQETLAEKEVDSRTDVDLTGESPRVHLELHYLELVPRATVF